MSATVTEPTCSGDHMPRGPKLDAAENKLTNLKKPQSGSKIRSSDACGVSE